MRILIADDDPANRLLLQGMLVSVGTCECVADGDEAVEAFRIALDGGEPYALLCLDIMMPNLSGQDTLERIRALERARGVPPEAEARALMVSALDDPVSVVRAFRDGGATSYIVKPVGKEKLFTELRRLRLIS